MPTVLMLLSFLLSLVAAVSIAEEGKVFILYGV
jgi:hypothetical protein